MKEFTSYVRLLVVFAPILLTFGGVALANSKILYIENPYARDKIGLSLCHISESRNAIQSPIDIDLQQVKKGQFGTDLNFSGLELIPSYMVIRNTGYECEYVRHIIYIQNKLLFFLVVSLEPHYPLSRPTIFNGPLNYRYEFDRIRVVFGKDIRGSEHAINGLKYAAEFQFIFYREDVGRLNATFTPDSTAILSLLYEIDDEPFFFNLKDSIKEIVVAGMSTNMTGNVPPLKLFIQNGNNFLYATYRGSFTFPPCTPNVIWLINLNAAGIPKDLVSL